ncbi:hypothetical protein E3N88_23513 [Mikania micrantha]|uniref:Uncharacterized protein n=1 Tax=Mikania micrantha TaxID=192012 RepID=A0A5N6NDJ6_9ASTR|nr:hypothetical protein E3N88_23513 [Mikania micrantha]
MATTPTHNRSSLPSQETIPHVSSQTLSQPRLKPALAVGTTTGPCYLLTSAAEECLTKSDILFANRPQLLAELIEELKQNMKGFSHDQKQKRNLIQMLWMQKPKP